MTGDIIFCLLIAVLPGNRLPELSIHWFTGDLTIIAAVVGIDGMHMIKPLVNRVFERKRVSPEWAERQAEHAQTAMTATVAASLEVKKRK